MSYLDFYFKFMNVMYCILFEIAIKICC